MTEFVDFVFVTLVLTFLSGAALASLIFIAWVATFAFYFVKSVIDNLLLERHRSRNARQTRKSKVHDG